MSEENENKTPEGGLTDAQMQLIRSLKNIGIDLWGVQDAGSAEPADGKTEKAENAAPVEEKKVGIDNLWMTADESVDWTEALAYDRPRDGLTTQKDWDFYHRMARKVLDGEIPAYVEVLETMNPLGDLAEYTDGMILRTPSADLIECVFQCKNEYMNAGAEKYLSALGLRAARDLMAILPVTEVRVTGRQGESDKMDVVFPREKMSGRNMCFVDPASFVTECGGEISI